MRWIVSGVSSVGKSSFIQHPRSQEICGVRAGYPVVLASDIGPKRDRMEDSCYFQYNILRCVELLHRNLMHGGSPQLREQARPAFGRDPTWRALVQSPIEKKASVLITSLR